LLKYPSARERVYQQKVILLDMSQITQSLSIMYMTCGIDVLIAWRLLFHVATNFIFRELLGLELFKYVVNPAVAFFPWQ
jgi:hypothetical protein